MGHFGPVLGLIVGPFWASFWTDCWAFWASSWTDSWAILEGEDDFGCVVVVPERPVGVEPVLSSMIENLVVLFDVWFYERPVG